jgi:hypothetical protein
VCPLLLCALDANPRPGTLVVSPALQLGHQPQQRVCKWAATVLPGMTFAPSHCALSSPTTPQPTTHQRRPRFARLTRSGHSRLSSTPLRPLPSLTRIRHSPPLPPPLAQHVTNTNHNHTITRLRTIGQCNHQRLRLRLPELLRLYRLPRLQRALFKQLDSNQPE